jgi:hypothetical protein
VGCIASHRREWASRILHEGSLYQHNGMVTLTYADRFLPRGGALVKPHFQAFMKTVRNWLEYSRRKDPEALPEVEALRYYGVGEYGELSLRPHYHLMMLGWTFPDLKRVEDAKGRVCWVSDLASEFWGQGFVHIAPFNPETAAYVAGYTMKKLAVLDPRVRHLPPPFALMSKRPGLGAEWIDRFQDDVFPCDEVVVQGRVAGKAPRYYDERVKKRDPELIAGVKAHRAARACEPGRLRDSTPERLRARERVAQARAGLRARATV